MVKSAWNALVWGGQAIESYIEKPIKQTLWIDVSDIEKRQSMAPEITKAFESKNFSEWAGRFVWDVGQFFIPVPWAQTQTLWKWASFISKLVSKAPTVAKDVLVSSAQNQWDIVKWATATAEWAALGFWLWKVGEGLKTMWKWIYNKLIPSTITEKWIMASKWQVPWEALKDIWTFGLGIFGSKQWMLDAIKEAQEIVWTKIDDMVSIAESTWNKQFTLRDIMNKAKESMTDDFLQNTLKINKVDLPDARKAINEAFKNISKSGAYSKTLTITWVQELKKDLYKWLEDTYKKIDTGKKIAEDVLTEKTIAKTAKKLLEDNLWAPLEELNKKYWLLKVIWNILNKKWDYSWVLTDTIAWGAAVAWTLASGQTDPQTILQNILFGVLLKKWLSSTVAKSTAASLSMRLWELLQSGKTENIMKALVSQNQ